MSLTKKFALALLALIAAICLAAVILILPSRSSSADVQTVEDEKYFVIEDGVFKGLSTEGISYVVGKQSKIVLPSSVTEVGSGTVPTSNSLFGSAARYVVEIEFADATKLQSIGNNAFAMMTALTKINIGDASSLNHIGNQAFNYCSALEDITVPENVANIGTNAFANCTGLKTIHYLATSASVIAHPFVLSESDYKNSDVTVYIGSATHAVQSLPSGLFSDAGGNGHKGITAVNFVNANLSGVNGWGNRVFKNCTSLTTVDFSDACTVDLINESAFEGCISLSKINLGGENLGLQSIMNNAFSGCSALCDIVIGPGVKTIGENAFANCYKLVEVVDLASLGIVKGSPNHGGVARYAVNVYNNTASLTVKEEGGYIFFVNGNDTYLLGYRGKDTDLTLPARYNSKIYKIYKYAFYRNNKVTSITVQNGVVTVGDYAFAQSTSLEEVTFPTSLMEVGDGTFKNSTALKQVTFGGALQTVRYEMFYGCTALTQIAISGVKNIDSEAFRGCSSLKTVDLTYSDGNPQLASIGGGAFRGCTSLTAFKIPSSVTKIETYAFEGCSSLIAVYLPGGTDAAVSVDYGSYVFDNCSSDLLLISTGSAQYDRDYSNLDSYTDKLTYEVKINLVYFDGYANVDGIHGNALQKLFGKSAGYERNSDGLTWSLGNNMPVQDDYSYSVWYTDRSFEKSKKVDLKKFTEMLADSVAIGNNDGAVDLYAVYIAKPALSANTGANMASYDGNSHTINEILKMSFRYNGFVITDETLANNIGFKSAFRYEITSHSFADGSYNNNWEWKGTITDAGTYNLVITLNADEYGSWETPFEVKFTIKPQEIEVNGKLVWETVGGGALLPSIEAGVPTQIYVFNGNPSLEGGGGVTPVNVLNSYTLSSPGTTVTVVLKWASGYEGYGVIDTTYSGTNSASELGVYTTGVTVRANNNYKFKYTVNNSYIWQGITVETNDSEMTVSKTWYIASSKSNHLLDENGAGMYAIKTDGNGIAWTYGDKETEENKFFPQVPTLSANPAQTKTAVSLTLKYDNGNGEVVIEENKNLGAAIALSVSGKQDLSYYFNSTTPAGKYTLIYKIDSVGDAAGGYETFEFRVGAWTYTQNEATIVENNLKTFKTEFDSGNRAVFQSTDDMISALNSERPQLDGEGIWQNHPEYYSTFEIGYQVKSGEHVNPDYSEYYSKDDYESGNYQGDIPQAIGTYTVFYRIAASNFDGAIYGKYELDIMHILTLEKFIGKSISFTGESLIGLIYEMFAYDIPDLDPYDIITLHPNYENSAASYLKSHGYSNDSYTSLGEHYVFILIKSSKRKYIGWENSSELTANLVQVTSVNYSDPTTKALKVPFMIDATKNFEKIPLSVIEWNYGEFTPEKNAPRWQLQFPDNRADAVNYRDYTFTLISTTTKKPGTDEYLKYFYYGDNREVGQDVNFRNAQPGEYILSASAPAYEGDGFAVNAGYNDKACYVTIGKATPQFTEVPYIASWSYGKYATDGKFSLQPSYTLIGNGYEIQGKIQISFCRVSQMDKLYSIDELLYDGELPIGNYYLVFTSEETEHFNAWRYNIRFQVTSTDKYDWVYGEYSAKVSKTDYRSSFGDPVNIRLEYKTSSILTGDWVDSIEKVKGFDPETGELPVGNYMLRAKFVSEQESYVIETINFKVIKATNTWTEIPTVKSWNKGNYSVIENYPVAKAQFGTALCILTDSKGREYNFDSINPDDLAIGTYKLTITIAGTDNYEELTTVLYFSITESSVGMTGIVTALIIFSVLAVGLAAAGITLLLLQKKKADADFRRSVKNELRRK